MATPSDKRNLYPRVVDFYNNKIIFLTGAAGFLGVVILEALLRCCPGIERIYILLRERRGVKPEDRKKPIFDRTIFNKLKEDNPEALSKVCVLPGDVSKPQLGMSEEDYLKVCEEASIVFHCAATISFTKPQRFILTHNFGATNSVIQLCRKMKHFEVLVYTSTAFSNSNRRTLLQERVYRLPFPAQDFLDVLMTEDDEKLEEIRAECLPEWPNHYTYSKSLSENLIQENSDLPIAIIRPSLIGSVWKQPLPGYSEQQSTLNQLCMGIGKGFIKVYCADPDITLDFIPVDVVANSHIVAAWRLATDRSSSPLIVNCVGHGSCDCSLGGFHECLMKQSREHLAPNCFRLSYKCTLEKNTFRYRIISFYEHYVPAYFIDMLLRLSGKKPKLVPLYRFFDKAMMTAHHFLTNSWDFETRNFKSLEEDIDPQEIKDFYTDLNECSIEVLSKDLHTGYPLYNWKLDKRSKEDRYRIAQQRHYLTVSVQMGFLICIALLLYIAVSQVLVFTTQ